MNDLEYAARNVHKWKEGENFICVRSCDQTIHWSKRPMTRMMYSSWTEGAWLAERARLQNKPNLSEWPKWAEYMGQCLDGDWRWFEREPKAGISLWKPGGRLFCSNTGEVLGDWRETLERRPEIDIDELIDTLSEDEWNKKSVSKLTRSVEWKQGELPPVSEECEVYRNGEWEPCEIIAHIEQPMGTIAVFSYGREPGYGISGVDCLIPRYFRPVDVSRAEEDRAVKDMAEIINDGTHTTCVEQATKIAKTLYAAGCRMKEPSE